MTAPAAGRDPAVDALRAIAITGVVVGHWLVTAPIAPRPTDGAVRLDSPLRAMPELAPVSWLLQTLGLFFLVAGFGAARSWSAATGKGWWTGRVRRLVAPVAALTGAVACVAAALALGGAPQSLVRRVVTLSLSPLWFLGVHLALLAATPVLVALDRRFGARAVVLPVVLAVVAPPLVVAAWWVPWQLGIATARRPLPRAAAAGLAVGGVAGVVLLVGLAGFPSAAVGVPGTAGSNLAPPSAATVCLALAQAGLAGLAAPLLARAGERPLVRAANRAALPVFLLHQPVLVALWLVTLPLGPLPGLHGAPDDAGWLLARALWLLPLAVVLARACGVPRARFPRRGTPLRVRR
ncbi:acyltransferase family protein [Geodermatophilus sp. SYSU D00815]